MVLHYQIRLSEIVGVVEVVKARLVNFVGVDLVKIQRLELGLSR